MLFGSADKLWFDYSVVLKCFIIRQVNVRLFSVYFMNAVVSDQLLALYSVSLSYCIPPSDFVVCHNLI